MKYLPVYLFLAVVLFVSCAEEKPDDLIEKDEFTLLLVEFELLRTYQRTHGDSVKTAGITRSVLDAYGITFDQFERSNQYYMSDEEEYRQLYREAIELLNMEIGRRRAPDPEQ